MRVRATAVTAALLLAALTACGGHDGGKADSAKPKTTAGKQEDRNVDCTDQSMSQADWMAYCSDEAGTGGDGTESKSKGLEFGESYTWPDGLEVAVVEAKVFTDYDKELLESPEPGQTDFRVKLKLTNTGKAAVALADLSLIVEGATNGGEAASTMFENGSAPLEGRLAPGVTTTKNHDNALESKYGKKVVVTVQRASEDFDIAFPEFNGEITS